MIRRPLISTLTDTLFPYTTLFRSTSGLRLTDFHAAPSCSPTRSMLLSGTDNHTSGVGAMAEAGGDRTRWGYEGHLTPRVTSLAERTRAAGYHTMKIGRASCRERVCQ